MTKFLIYLLLLGLIFLLPEKFWDKLWSQALKLAEFLQRFFRQLGLQKERTPLIGDIYLGEKLLRFFPQIEAKMATGQKTFDFELPKFKFYTTLLADLLEAHRKLGVSLKTILPELRGNLIKELQFEKKILNLVFGGNLQFLVVVLTTWSFIFLSSQLADLSLSFVNLFIIGSVQLMALILFNVCFMRLRERGLKKYSVALEQLYLFTGMVEVGLPVNFVLGQSNVLNGEIGRHKGFGQCYERLFNLVNRWKEQGLSPKTETQEIINEIWHLKEEGYDRFIKHLDLLKFTILAFFFLPAYFFYLYSIFQFFMEQ